MHFLFTPSTLCGEAQEVEDALAGVWPQIGGRHLMITSVIMTTSAFMEFLTLTVLKVLLLLPCIVLQDLLPLVLLHQLLTQHLQQPQLCIPLFSAMDAMRNPFSMRDTSVLFAMITTFVLPVSPRTLHQTLVDLCMMQRIHFSRSLIQSRILCQFAQ
jgi:hypothetical protein